MASFKNRFKMKGMDKVSKQKSVSSMGCCSLLGRFAKDSTTHGIPNMQTKSGKVYFRPDCNYF